MSSALQQFLAVWAAKCVQETRLGRGFTPELRLPLMNMYDEAATWVFLGRTEPHTHPFPAYRLERFLEEVLKKWVASPIVERFTLFLFEMANCTLIYF